MTLRHESTIRALALIIVSLAYASASASDDFSGVDPDPWLVLHPELTEASISNGQLILRPSPQTAWYGNLEAHHRYLLVDGDFAMTSRVEVGDLAGGPAQPDWRLGGLLVRDPGPGDIHAYHAAFGTVDAAWSSEMVVEYKSTVAGNSELDFVPHPSGSGELRICRVGSTVRALFRSDEATEWTTLDQRERPDLPETVAAGPMAYAYASVADFEAAFDYVDFEPLTTMDDCEPDLAESTGGSTSSEGEGTSTGDSGSDTVGPPPTAVPLPTGECPPMIDGPAEFCPAGLGGCRFVELINSEDGTTAGPLQVHWHGTNESPQSLLEDDMVTEEILDRVLEEGGVLALPWADGAAEARTGPFPWWVVGDSTDPQMETNRLDDFILFDEIAACVIEAGRASPERINSSGFSAGGIMTSHIVAERGYVASAVSWSGGMPTEYQPMVPMGPTAVMAVHGGTGDVYSGEGVDDDYSFVGPTEALAVDVVAAGSFAFVCDHQSGHAPNFGVEGADFMMAARLGLSHPWTDDPFGSHASYALQHDCYAAGESSPHL